MGGELLRIMNISQGFIERPIATSLLMFAIALFGVVYTYMAKILEIWRKGRRETVPQFD